MRDMDDIGNRRVEEVATTSPLHVYDVLNRSDGSTLYVMTGTLDYSNPEEMVASGEWMVARSDAFETVER